MARQNYFVCPRCGSCLDSDPRPPRAIHTEEQLESIIKAAVDRHLATIQEELSCVEARMKELLFKGME